MDQAAILRDYKVLRRKSLAVGRRLVESLNGDEMRAAAAAMGILRGKNQILFDSEDQASVMMDYAIHNLFRDGHNAVGRLLEQNPYPEGSPELRLLQAMRDSHFTIFQVTMQIPGLGVRGLDGREETPIVIVDVGFSQTAVPGLAIATRIFSTDEGWWMTTGASLPLNEEAMDRIIRELKDYERRFGCDPPETEFQRIVTRAAIASGASEQVAYADPGTKLEHTPAGTTVRVPPKVGRNDPCPCGSGKKYKKCCGSGSAS